MALSLNTAGKLLRLKYRRSISGDLGLVCSRGVKYNSNNDEVVWMTTAVAWDSVLGKEVVFPYYESTANGFQIAKENALGYLGVIAGAKGYRYTPLYIPFNYTTFRFAVKLETVRSAKNKSVATNMYAYLPMSIQGESKTLLLEDSARNIMSLKAVDWDGLEAEIAVLMRKVIKPSGLSV